MSVSSSQLPAVEFDLVISRIVALRPAMFYTNDTELIGNDLIESGITFTFDDHRSPVTAVFGDSEIHRRKNSLPKTVEIFIGCLNICYTLYFNLL